ncbi:MAG: hypothetical protein ACI4HO_04165 [Ruminococcus sp.]
MKNEPKNLDIIKKFRNLTDSLGFPQNQLKDLSIYLAFLYVNTERMKPYGYWFRFVPHMAYNDEHSQNDLKILIEEFPSTTIDKSIATVLWELLDSISLQTFLSVFYKHQQNFTLIDVVCSILGRVYSSTYAEVFNLYLIQKQGKLDYKQYVCFHDYFIRKLRYHNYIESPLSEVDYTRLYYALYQNIIDISQYIITKGSATTLFENICEFATSKNQRLALYSQYKELSMSTTSEVNEEYLRLAECVDPSDYLIAMESIAEAELECNIIFGRVFSRQYRTILLVNPSIELIRLMDKKSKEINDYLGLFQNPEKNKLEVYVIVDSDIKQQLLSFEFRNLFFYSNNCFVGLKHIDAFYCCATTRASLKMFEDVITRINNMDNDRAVCNVIIGNNFKSELLAISSKCNLSIERVDSIPSGITESKPKMKSIVAFRINKKQADLVVLREHFTINNKLMGLKNVKRISKEIFCSGTSILDLLKGRLIKQPLYNKAVEMHFSKELSIFYKWYPDSKKSHGNRVIAFLRENIKEGSRASKGKTIKKSEKEKRINCVPVVLDYEIEQWLMKKYILSPDVYEIACGLIKEKLPPKTPMTLRSFWLINKHKLSHLEMDIQNALELLALDNSIGMIIVGEAVGKDYEDAIKNTSFCKEKYLYLEALEELLEFARKAKLYDSNPISSIFHIRRKEKADYDSIRSALTKKTFSKGEEISIVNKLLKTADSNPYYLAVLLEIFTGLSVNEIAALKKNSLVKLPYSKGYYLSVHETYKKENGKDLLTVHRKREKHRKIPVISLVSRFFENLDNSDSEYLLTHPDTNEPLRPWKISETIRDLFSEEINIEEDLIYLPKRDGNWRVTDLNKYYGDFLRTNFRFRLLNECMMEVMECDYLLGNQRKNAYGKSYCDFSNDFMQIKLYKKLCRWETWYAQNTRLPETIAVNSRNSIHLTERTGRVSVSVRINASDNTTVSVSSINGVSGTVLATKRGDKK